MDSANDSVVGGRGSPLPRALGCPKPEKAPLEAQVQIPGTDLHFLSKVAPVADKTVNRLD